MKARALILKAYDGISYDGGFELIEFVGLKKPYPPSSFPSNAIEFLHFLINRLVNSVIADNIQHKAKIGIKDLIINKPEVREYIMQQARVNTTSNIILYEGNSSVQIVSKLTTLENKEHFEILYMGGGHGQRDMQFSGLKISELKCVIKFLKKKNISASSIILGSCYSAAFADNFLPLLTKAGIMISDTTTCVNDHFSETLHFLKNKKSVFLQPKPTMSMAECARVAATEILELPGDKISHEQFKNLSKKLIDLDSKIFSSKISSKALLREFKFIEEGINNLTESTYFTDNLENHVQKLLGLLKIRGNIAMVDFLRETFINNLDPQSNLFYQFVIQLINKFNIICLEGLEKKLCKNNIEKILEEGDSFNVIPHTKNVKTLTQLILTQLSHKAREAHGIQVTGKALTNVNSLFVTILDKNLTGTPPGAHSDDIEENHVIIKKLCKNRQLNIKERQDLIDSKTCVSSNLHKINFDIQRNIFNNLFRKSIRSSKVQRQQIGLTR